MTGSSVWFCPRCRCANAPARRLCAACGAFAPEPAAATTTARAPPPVVAPLPPAAPLPAPPLSPPPSAPRPAVAAAPPPPLPPPPTPVAVLRTGDVEPVDPEACPVCIGRLVAFAPGERRCPACGGAWLDPSAIARLFAVPPRDLAPAERRALRARFAPRTEGSVPRARTCPVCGEATTRRPATAAGSIWGDACDAHGVWLSARDREALGEFLAAGGASLPPEPVRTKPIHFLGSSGSDEYGPAERLTRPAPKPVRAFGTAQPAGAAAGDALPPDLPRVCPTCSVPLGAASGEGVPVLACAACAGRWVPAASFRAVAAQKPAEPLTPVERARVRAKATAAPVPHDARPLLLCPECRRTLQRRLVTPYGPVRVDLCRAHGVWFDAGELDRWAEFVREGGATLPPPPHRTHPPAPLGSGTGTDTLIWLALEGAFEAAGWFL